MDLKREQLFEILEEAEGLGLPAPAGVVLKLFREETEELIKNIPLQQIEQIPIFSLMRSGLVPAPGQSGLTLKSDGWERVSTPLPLFTGVGGGGGSSGGAGGVTQHSLLTQLDYASAGHTGFQPTMTGAMVLALLLPVDGAGSGLDADLLDGNHAAAFALAGHLHAGVYEPVDATIVRTGDLNWIALTGGGVTALHSHAAPAGMGDVIDSGVVVGQLVKGVVDSKHIIAAALIPPAANILTLTNAAASTLALNITAAKTLTLTAVNDYNLTIPATGVAALLATQNVFTVQQMIDGTSDQIQLRVQGHSTQTSALQTWEYTGGPVLASVSGGGNFGIGIAPDANDSILVYKDGNVGGAWGIKAYRIIVAGNCTAGDTGALNFDTQITGSSGNRTTVYGVMGRLYINQSGTTNLNGTAAAVYGQSRIFASPNNSGTLYVFQGLYWHDNGGSMANAVIYNAQTIIDAGVTTTNLTIFNVDTITNNGTITNLYGLKIADINSGASLNYAILTNAGNIVFNEGGDANTDFRVESDSYDALFVDAGNNSIELMSNAAGKVGFFGVTAVVQQTELTDELTTITFTAPGVPDYAIQDFIDIQGDGSKGFSFANKDEANSILSVIANLQTRVNELETKLVAYGLLVDAD